VFEFSGSAIVAETLTAVFTLSDVANGKNYAQPQKQLIADKT
jgi:hypothetical protein